MLLAFCNATQKSDELTLLLAIVESEYVKVCRKTKITSI